MFLSADKAYAEAYIRLDAEKALERCFLTFELIQRINLLDITGIEACQLASDAITRYGANKVGGAALPVRNHMLETVRLINPILDGTISSGGHEIHFDENLLKVAQQIS